MSIHEKFINEQIEVADLALTRKLKELSELKKSGMIPREKLIAMCEEIARIAWSLAEFTKPRRPADDVDVRRYYGVANFIGQMAKDEAKELSALH